MTIVIDGPMPDEVPTLGPGGSMLFQAPIGPLRTWRLHYYWNICDEYESSTGQCMVRLDLDADLTAPEMENDQTRLAFVKKWARDTMEEAVESGEDGYILKMGVIRRKK